MPLSISSFPVLANESCSPRSSHLGSHPVYWPGATSGLVSVSDQLCQLSHPRGFSLSSAQVRPSISVQPPAVGPWSMVHDSGPWPTLHGLCGTGPPQRGPSELAEWTGHACRVGPSSSHSVPPVPLGLVPSACPACHPTSNAACTVPPPVPPGQAVYLGPHLCGAPLGHLSEIRGKASAPASLIQHAGRQSHLSLEPGLS